MDWYHISNIETMSEMTLKENSIRDGRNRKHPIMSRNGRASGGNRSPAVAETCDAGGDIEGKIIVQMIMSGCVIARPEDRKRFVPRVIHETVEGTSENKIGVVLLYEKSWVDGTMRHGLKVPQNEDSGGSIL